MRNSVDRLAEKITERPKQPLKLTSPSTASGNSALASKRDGVPLPLGDEGQVLTVWNDGTRDIPAWRDPATGTGTRYRRYMVTNDPDSAGYIIMEAGPGIPMYDLYTLES